MKGVALVVVVFILASALAEAGLPINKPKKVRCKNKYSPCYEKDLYCPASCPRTCSVNCNSCQAVCGLVPPFPPPPSKFQKPKTVECKDRKFSSCYNKPLNCPASCSRTCSVDCATCQPVCHSVNLPHSPSPKRVRCMNKKYPACYYREFICPAACPQTCQVDSVTCSPVCSKPINTLLSACLP